MNKKTLWILIIILQIPFLITFLLSAESLGRAYQSGNSDLIRLWICIYASQPLTMGLFYLLAKSFVKLSRKHK